MDCKTIACQRLESCIEAVKTTKTVTSKNIETFKKAIANPNDDPGYYKLLSLIAIKSGLQPYIHEMWDYYGITDKARSLFLKQRREPITAVVCDGALSVRAYANPQAAP